MYTHFSMACAFNPLAITTTLLFNILNTSISLSPIAEHGSILCSGLIFAYIFLCYSTLSALPAAVQPVRWPRLGRVARGVAVAGVTLFYIGYRQARHRQE